MNIEEEIKNAQYDPTMEKILGIIERKTNNNSHNYFRVVISFYLAQVASSMRCKIKGKVNNNVPVNMYACGLMQSGAGKGHSQDILESQVVNKFRNTFMNSTMPHVAKTSLEKLATQKSIVTGMPVDECLKALTAEYMDYGNFPYAFDSATGPAFKQVRAKAQLAKIGALSFICDEIGSNILANPELLAIGLEVFDLGKTKNKLTKDSANSKRAESREDPVPTNMLWFGTPAKLLNSGKEEDEFYSQLQAGYARRLFYGEGIKQNKKFKSGKEFREDLLKGNSDKTLQDLSDSLGILSNLQYYDKTLLLGDAEEELLYDYQLYCEQRAESLSDEATEALSKAELSTRHWKALKLAGAYAFCEKSNTVERRHLLAAFKLAEDSGQSFRKIMYRDPDFVKLAKYISKAGKPLTYAALAEVLPFFKDKQKQATEYLITLASAWGYDNGIAIKSFEINKIPFLEGQRLEETNLDKIIISTSNDISNNYQNQEIPWTKINRLGKANGLHWCTHHFMPDTAHPELGNHRSQKYVIPAFNLLALDIDGNCSIESAQEILKNYTYCIYTTKSHTEATPRFRIILPMKYKLFLNKDDYSIFMQNIFDTLPFVGIDAQTKDIARKWLTNDGQVFMNKGELFDPRPFIPDTAQDRERKEKIKQYGDIDNITRWFLERIKEGNRNCQLFRYGMMLKDQGYDINEVESRILGLNAKLDKPLDINEIHTTIIQSISVK